MWFEMGVYIFGKRLAKHVGGGIAVLIGECGFWNGYLEYFTLDRAFRIF